MPPLTSSRRGSLQHDGPEVHRRDSTCVKAESADQSHDHFKEILLQHAALQEQLCAEHYSVVTALQAEVRELRSLLDHVTGAEAPSSAGTSPSSKAAISRDRFQAQPETQARDGRRSSKGSECDIGDAEDTLLSSRSSKSKTSVCTPGLAGRRGVPMSLFSTPLRGEAGLKRSDAQADPCRSIGDLAGAAVAPRDLLPTLLQPPKHMLKHASTDHYNSEPLSPMTESPITDDNSNTQEELREGYLSEAAHSVEDSMVPGVVTHLSHSQTLPVPPSRRRKRSLSNDQQRQLAERRPSKVDSLPSDLYALHELMSSRRSYRSRSVSSRSSDSGSELLVATPRPDAPFYMWDCWEEVLHEDTLDEDTLGELTNRIGRSKSTPVAFEHSATANSLSVEMQRHCMEKKNPRDGPGQCLEWALQCFTVHPSSVKRITWVSVSVVLVTYDVIVTPMGFFDLSPSVTSVLDRMEWATTLFWTFDLPAGFLAGYHDEASDVELRVRKTAWRYLSGWFGFDSSLVLLDWLALAATAGWLHGHGSNWSGILRAGRLLRLARTVQSLRILRDLRLPRLVEQAWTSEYTRLTLGLLGALSGILLVNHHIACLWYFFGTRDGGWVEAYFEDSKVATPMLYMTSLHWSLTQFTPASMKVEPQNLAERTFAVAVLIFALVAFSSFVSAITDCMTHLRKINFAQAKQFMQLDQYLQEHDISFSLSVRVRRYLEHLLRDERKNLQEGDCQLLYRLSNPLQMELRYELHAPELVKHPFFALYAEANRTVVQRVCLEAVKTILFCEGDLIFSMGDQAHSMYFVSLGSFCYSRQARVSLTSANIDEQAHQAATSGKPERIRSGQWFCEAVLWTPWEHRGEMRALTEGRLLAVDSCRFRLILAKNRTAAFPSAAYAAEFVARLCECRRTELTDLDYQVLDSAGMVQRSFDRIREEQPELEREISACRTGSFAGSSSHSGTWFNRVSIGNPNTQSLEPDLQERRTSVGGTPGLLAVAVKAAATVFSARSQLEVSSPTADHRAHIEDGGA